MPSCICLLIKEQYDVGGERGIPPLLTPRSTTDTTCV